MAYKPLLKIVSSRSFGALRGVARRRTEVRMTYVQGLVRFGFDKNGDFTVEVMTEGGSAPAIVEKGVE